ncbi:hypothetical protein SEA_HONK_69 [Microbacterium phage Honk]|uniref:DUF7246 domain-containing protein n=1 Tax=Microbacterium phage Honk TaxID=2836095 RepID=A0A8F3INV3_9CAUD|nr:hypothetical protein SEA_HONK_69 [Microbacterium phage Honk]
MSRRRKLPGLPHDWIESRELVINGRHVSPGVELSIRGERGRFRFVKHVIRPERGVEWIDVWGGPKGCPQLRAFRPEDVRRVHRIKRTDKGILDERREARATERSESSTQPLRPSETRPDRQPLTTRPSSARVAPAARPTSAASPTPRRRSRTTPTSTAPRSSSRTSSASAPSSASSRRPSPATSSTAAHARR